MVRSVTLAGNGDFDFDVVGEGHYQDHFDEICGGKCEGGHELRIPVILVHDNENQHDRQAIAVYSKHGKLLAYLSREDAADFRSDMAELGAAGVPALCAAMIVGGWDRGDGDAGSYGLRLDLEWPLELADDTDTDADADDLQPAAAKSTGCLGSLALIGLLTAYAWSIPNNEAGWVQDLGFDACRAVAGHDDWQCE